MWVEYDDYIKHNQLLDEMTTAFSATYNDITELPELPINLKELHCYYKLIVLPALPNKLIFLDCAHNNLTELPELPKTLISLMCENNNIKYLSPSNCEVIKNIKKLDILYNPVSNGFASNPEFKEMLF